MTQIPSIELQKAIYSALSAKYTVVSVKPSNPKFPFVEIGLEIERDESVKSHERSYHHLTVHTWSKSNSATEIKTINHVVKSQIMNLQSVNGFGVDYVKLDNILTLTEPLAETTIWHGVLQFEITLTGKERGR